MTSKFILIPSFYPIPDGKGHWVSREELRYFSGIIGDELIVPEGSVNDLASIPWALRRVFPINGPSRIAAALHDYLYEKQGRIGDLELSRHECDLVFLEAMSVPKRSLLDAYTGRVLSYLTSSKLIDAFQTNKPVVDKVTANLMYAGVRIGGWASW